MIAYTDILNAIKLSFDKIFKTYISSQTCDRKSLLIWIEHQISKIYNLKSIKEI